MAAAPVGFHKSTTTGVVAQTIPIPAHGVVQAIPTTVSFPEHFSQFPPKEDDPLPGWMDRMAHTCARLHALAQQDPYDKAALKHNITADWLKCPVRPNALLRAAYNFQLDDRTQQRIVDAYAHVLVKSDRQMGLFVCPKQPHIWGILERRQP